MRLPVSAARNILLDAIDQARTEPVLLERYGRPAAVTISPGYYKGLVQALEDVDDINAFDAAMAEEGPNILWDRGKIDLGRA